VDVVDSWPVFVASAAYTETDRIRELEAAGWIQQDYLRWIHEAAVLAGLVCFGPETRPAWHFASELPVIVSTDGPPPPVTRVGLWVPAWVERLHAPVLRRTRRRFRDEGALASYLDVAVPLLRKGYDHPDVQRLLVEEALLGRAG
jgi:hypothetical protein